MFEQDNVLDETVKFIKGENKPTIIFEVSYTNLIFIFLGLIITLVLSGVLTHYLTKTA